MTLRNPTQRNDNGPKGRHCWAISDKQIKYGGWAQTNMKYEDKLNMQYVYYTQW